MHKAKESECKNGWQKTDESAKNKVKKLQKVNKGVIDQGFFEIVINVTKQVGFFNF